MGRLRHDVLPVTLRDLRVSAYHNIWIKLGMGVQARARQVDIGYELRIRYGTLDVTHYSTIVVKEVPYGKTRLRRPSLICAGCFKPTTRMLFLGSDFHWRCSKCLGIKPWQIRTPMRFDLGEDIKFRKLLRRKIDEDVLKFEIAALQTLSSEEFFTSRPYLVPEFVERVRLVDADLYQKLLKVMHGKYRSVMLRRRVRCISEKQAEWLLEKLQIVFEKAYIISKREVAWLTKERERRLAMRQSEQGLLNGNQSGTKQDLSASQPMEIECSLSKMNSNQDTSVEVVTEQGDEPVTTAMEEEKLAKR